MTDGISLLLNHLRFARHFENSPSHILPLITIRYTILDIRFVTSRQQSQRTPTSSSTQLAVLITIKMASALAANPGHGLRAILFIYRVLLVLRSLRHSLMRACTLSKAC